eukprot:2361177-Pleurochrysis_carterae.AAC.5
MPRLSTRWPLRFCTSTRSKCCAARCLGPSASECAPRASECAPRASVCAPCVFPPNCAAGVLDVARRGSVPEDPRGRATAHASAIRPHACGRTPRVWMPQPESGRSKRIAATEAYHNRAVREPSRDRQHSAARGLFILRLPLLVAASKVHCWIRGKCKCAGGDGGDSHACAAELQEVLRRGKARWRNVCDGAASICERQPCAMLMDTIREGIANCMRTASAGSCCWRGRELAREKRLLAQGI